MTLTVDRQDVKAGRRICVEKHDYMMVRVYRYGGVARQYMFQCRNCGNQRLISKAAFWR